MREALLAVVLTIAAGLVCLGVFLLSVPAGLMVSGVALAGLGFVSLTGPDS